MEPETTFKVLKTNEIKVEGKLLYTEIYVDVIDRRILENGPTVQGDINTIKEDPSKINRVVEDFIDIKNGTMILIIYLHNIQYLLY